MEENNLQILGRILRALNTTLQHRKQDNKGAAFKINTKNQWSGTLAIRLHHVYIKAITRYIDLVVHQLQSHDRLAWWEHTSIARCFDFERLNGKRSIAYTRKMVYVTLRIPPTLHMRLRDEWPDDTFRNLSVLVEWLKEQEKVDEQKNMG